MIIGGMGSNNYYMEQMSAMGGHSGQGMMPGPKPPQGAAMGDRPDPAAIFNKVDQDGSAGLDQTEFQTLADKISKATGQEVDVEELFATYDEDGDGVLNEEETTAALEANRPAGPPPPREDMNAGAAGSMSVSAFQSGFERYLQVAAMGMAQNQTNFSFSMFAANGDGNPGGLYNSVDTWS